MRYRCYDADTDTDSPDLLTPLNPKLFGSLRLSEAYMRQLTNNQWYI